jgi:hypothetical protein
MNRKIRFVALTGIVVLLLAGLSACAAPEPAGLTDEQVSAVTENALLALNEGDYARFTQDFSDQMIAALPEAKFDQLRDLLQTTSGNYLSIGTPVLTNAQGFATYRFPCQFDLEEVTVTITFTIGGDKVEGLFFTSPNLRSSGGQ